MEAGGELRQQRAEPAADGQRLEAVLETADVGGGDPGQRRQHVGGLVGQIASAAFLYISGCVNCWCSFRQNSKPAGVRSAHLRVVSGVGGP